MSLLEYVSTLLKAIFLLAQLIQSLTESSGVYNQKCQLLEFNLPRLWVCEQYFIDLFDPLFNIC